ncbi:uncharacterized protein LOC62_06G007924 [Vanrija pseudolonga]|uniref:Uncharacterized protein n=1 Tax=Vanrija pseudolonga TaxID=143232 RepID=A0AAF1BT70_9TREE|nr:hypothetical protein LOC62_06G007924 [Vanrija pseudolonga]
MAGQTAFKAALLPLAWGFFLHLPIPLPLLLIHTRPHTTMAEQYEQYFDEYQELGEDVTPANLPPQHLVYAIAYGAYHRIVSADGAPKHKHERVGYLELAATKVVGDVKGRDFGGRVDPDAAEKLVVKELDTMSDQFQDQYNQVQNLAPEEHRAKLTHELAAGAVSYEAAKKYEEYRAQNGEPDSHAKRDEIIAGFAGAIGDREFETKGLDWLDRDKVVQDATQQLKYL